MERVLIREYPSPPPAHKIIPLKLLLLIKASPAFKEFVGWLVLRFTSLGFSVKAWVRNCLLEQKQCTSGYTTEKYNCPPLATFSCHSCSGTGRVPVSPLVECANWPSLLQVLCRQVGRFAKSHVIPRDRILYCSFPSSTLNLFCSLFHEAPWVLKG